MLQWVDRTPPEWVPDLAVLYTRMSTDAPSAGLAEPEQLWTPERVMQKEQKAAAGRRTALTSAVLHGPSGHLVGFTELEVPVESRRAVSQEDTLVLREHRGRRLGMLLKVANLEAVAHAPRESDDLATVQRRRLDEKQGQGFGELVGGDRTGDRRLPGHPRSELRNLGGISSSGEVSYSCSIDSFPAVGDPQRSRWQRGQRCELRFMNCCRTSSVPQRGHGRPCRP
ncbi:hypothetical protein [Cryobacterium sp. TMT2-15-1]|uniref:hypothetical protein n=1 Tax=Cryobacterium sp. TMT2-15-1 TaxID=1259246 RepID=UPI00106B35BC|nr:hypothetical protein [Cryobacterium sp. TMT2-15-1]